MQLKNVTYSTSALEIFRQCSARAKQIYFVFGQFTVVAIRDWLEKGEWWD